MAVKNYLINDKWLDLDKQNIVEVKSTDGVIGSVKLNGEEYGGGGGSSDFSTAQLTVVNNASNTHKIIVPFIDNITEPNASFAFIELESGGNTNVTVILYKNLCGCQILGGGTLSVTGNATVASPTIVAMSGDCTITID